MFYSSIIRIEINSLRMRHPCGSLDTGSGVYIRLIHRQIMAGTRENLIFF
jgi:hypothetical protein